MCVCVCPDDNVRTDNPIEFKLGTHLLGSKTEAKFDFGENRTRRSYQDERIGLHTVVAFEVAKCKPDVHKKKSQIQARCP